jgi:hypothetical protein
VLFPGFIGYLGYKYEVRLITAMMVEPVHAALLSEGRVSGDHCLTDCWIGQVGIPRQEKGGYYFGVVDKMRWDESLLVGTRIERAG